MLCIWKIHSTVGFAGAILWWRRALEDRIDGQVWCVLNERDVENFGRIAITDQSDVEWGHVVRVEAD